MTSNGGNVTISRAATPGPVAASGTPAPTPEQQQPHGSEEPPRQDGGKKRNDDRGDSENDTEDLEEEPAKDKKKKKIRRKPVEELQSAKGWAQGGRGEASGAAYSAVQAGEGTGPASRVKAKSAWITEKSRSIRTWLTYRANHPTKKRWAVGGDGDDSEAVPQRTGKVDLSDPFTVLMYELAGLTPPSRATAGLQQFMHEAWESKIEPEVERRWRATPAHERRDKAGKTLKTPPLKLGTEVARSLWREMDRGEQQVYRDHASADAELVKTAFAEAMKDWPRTDPASRQQAINNLEPLMRKLLTKVSEMTGLHLLVMAGGPIPNLRGDIRVMDYSFGENLAPMPRSFPQWDPEHFEEHAREKMKSYLRTAYTSADCEAASLPEDQCMGARQATDDQSPPILDEHGLLQMPELPEASAPPPNATTSQTAVKGKKRSAPVTNSKAKPAAKAKAGECYIHAHSLRALRSPDLPETSEAPDSGLRTPNSETGRPPT
ncbi:hypothetical protein C8F01DRAFT_1263653 [Mycena amicta]|nr:hypothetical protein C8F01DRAFT_1263653 [Mycena amicta]